MPDSVGKAAVPGTERRIRCIGRIMNKRRIFVKLQRIKAM
jgi:hypothetical protein